MCLWFLTWNFKHNLDIGALDIAMELIPDDHVNDKSTATGSGRRQWRHVRR